MKKICLVLLVIMTSLLASCSQTKYEGIKKEASFIASVNILQPSIDFFTTTGEKLATWDLEENYTGATLINDTSILLYGNQLEYADLYNVTTGALMKRIKVQKGATYAYYNKDRQQFYIANGEYNTVIAYDKKGMEKKTMKSGLYPMAMVANGDNLFVINFKDTFMSVFDAKTYELQRKIKIPKSSHGMDFIGNELWIGGHGAGEEPNSTVQRMNPQTGEKLGELQLPIMPIAFTNFKKHEYVLSHGESVLYELDSQQKITWQQEIGSNPFALASLKEAIVVAGYDDQTLYWIEDHKITRKVKVGQGPFQLLVREVN